MRAKAMVFVLAAGLVTASAAHGAITKSRPLKTGQTTSYGAAGDTTAGQTRSYKDLGNGVIKDQKTGLFWEKKSDDESIHDWDDAYTWSTGSPWSANGTAFTVFLAALNTPPCFGGFCDWRLPTYMELITLLDLGRLGPAATIEFDTGCTPGCPVTACSCTASDDYWTSTTSENGPYNAWGIDFYNGFVDNSNKSNSDRVRAVRGGGA